VAAAACAILQALDEHKDGGLVPRTASVAGEEFALTPYTEEPFSIRRESLFPLVRHTVCRAAVARASFRESAPHWAPELPVSSADCEKMIRSKSNKIALVGYFGRSWACANWGPHPSFRDYCCGLMASPHCPEHIRNDPELRKEFPPRELPDLDENLCWGIFGRIVEYTQEFLRNEAHWRRCGRTDDAKWMRGVIERIAKITFSKWLQDFLDSQPDRRT
jgi:hypothetical protein